MPRIDPISGCTVMTHQEFWAAEAATEGKGRTASDLMADFFNELDAANAVQADRYRTDLAWTTEQLRAAIADYNDGVDPGEELPSLVRVLEVLEADVQDGVRSSSLFIRVRALRAASPEPIEDILDYTDVATSGSRMEPPDRESSLEWRTLNNNPLHTCTGCPRLLEYKGWCPACAVSAATGLAFAGTRWTTHDLGSRSPPDPITLSSFMMLHARRLGAADYERLLSLPLRGIFDVMVSLTRRTRLTRVA